ANSPRNAVDGGRRRAFSASAAAGGGGVSAIGAPTLARPRVAGKRCGAGAHLDQLADRIPVPRRRDGRERAVEVVAGELRLGHAVLQVQVEVASAQLELVAG